MPASQHSPEPITFQPWPKTARLFKDAWVVSEKIDGTNAAIGVLEGRHVLEGGNDDHVGHVVWIEMADTDGEVHHYSVYAQSRNRLIWPGKGSDNYAFAEWVFTNAHDLARVLGPGLHYGEWWGAGIARGYGRTDRTFSLFNTSRWRHLNDPEAREALNPPKELSVVPVLAVRSPDTNVVKGCLEVLREDGSIAQPGYMNPEGVCVFVGSSQTVYKVTFDGDRPKGVMRTLEEELAA